MSSPGESKPYLSPSQIETYLRCGEAYRRRYVEGERIPPGIVAVQGTGVHVGAEVNFKQKILTGSDLPVRDIIDASVDGFDRGLTEGWTVDPEGPSVGDARDEVASLATVLATEVCPEYQPTHVEQTVKIELPGAHDMLGVIDLAADGKVIDLKTTSKVWSQKQVDTNPQITFYAAAHRVLTGELAQEVVIENLVKTKKPKRVKLSSTRDRGDFSALAARINAVSAGIEAGVFVPAEAGSWMCSPRWCGYYDSCPYVNGQKTTIVDLHVPGE